MNSDENYGFDIAGFLHLHQVLDAEEVEAGLRLVEEAGGQGPIEWSSQGNAVLQGYLEALCGADYVVEQTPRVVAGSAEADGRATFAPGDPEGNRRLRYVCHGEVRVCNGLKVVVALAPTPEERGLRPCSGQPQERYRTASPLHLRSR